MVTEKIDGTNAQLLIHNKTSFLGDFFQLIGPDHAQRLIEPDKEWEKVLQNPNAILLPDDHVMFVGSRNKWLNKNSDNFGFFNWAAEHASELVKLGIGRHYGEWWGLGIQRGYGLQEKRLSLFNTTRWGLRLAQHPFTTVPGLGIVPEIYRGPHHRTHDLKPSWAPEHCLQLLKEYGSFAAPGFKDPEGIIMFHTKSNQMYKMTLDKDEQGKGE